MEEDEGFHDHETEKQESSQWQFSGFTQFERKTSKTTIENEKYHLNLVKKKVWKSRRKAVKSSKFERLSYYRTYVTSANKTQIICLQHVQFNWFFWYYIIHLFLKSLPHSYLYFVLAAYAPEEHLFLFNMVPVVYGFKFVFLIAGFMEIVGYIDTEIMLLDYVIQGILYKNPWNRCSASQYLVNNSTVHCYNISEFTKMFVNHSVSLVNNFYMTNASELFQVAQIEYYRQKTVQWEAQILSFIYIIAILFAAALLHTQVYKKSFWKFLNIMQWTINAIDLITFLSIFYDELKGNEQPISHVQAEDFHNILWQADIDMLAESTTAPPVVHVLTARSKQDIQPNRDSAVMITSNAILYIFRGLLTFKIMEQVQNLVKAPIYITDYNRHSWFYFWPMYFTKFYFGNLYTLLFFGLNFLMEFLSITVTYFCFVEVIISQWKLSKRYMITSTLSCIAVLVFYATKYKLRLTFYLYCKFLVSLVEILVLYWIYPLGRLLDDITFHFGLSPTLFRIVSLRIVPIYYILKCYVFLKVFIGVILTADVDELFKYHFWTWCIVLIPIVVGGFYITFVYVFQYKKSWLLVFRPDSTWGPRDPVISYLRKLYDSRTYIKCEASRLLSRYLISKTEPKSYVLDVRYNSSRRSTAVNTTSLQFEVERESKKIL